MDFPVINWWWVLYNLVHIGTAYLLALPVAWDRERAARGAGLRTFPLVAVASCGYVLMTHRLFAESPDAQARVLQGLMTGIGFVGGGAILKKGANVRGLATAASIWNTGAVGAAVAYRRYEIALVLSLLNFVTLRFLTPLKGNARGDEDEGA